MIRAVSIIILLLLTACPPKYKYPECTLHSYSDNNPHCDKYHLIK